MRGPRRSWVLIKGAALGLLLLICSATSGSSAPTSARFGPVEALQLTLDAMVRSNGEDTALGFSDKAPAYYTPELTRLVLHGWAVAKRRLINLRDGEFITGAQGVEHMAVRNVAIAAMGDDTASVDAEIGSVDDHKTITVFRRFRFRMKRFDGVWLIDDVVEPRVPNQRGSVEDFSLRAWFGGVDSMDLLPGDPGGPASDALIHYAKTKQVEVEQRGLTSLRPLVTVTTKVGVFYGRDGDQAKSALASIAYTPTSGNAIMQDVVLLDRGSDKEFQVRGSVTGMLGFVSNASFEGRDIMATTSTLRPGDPHCCPTGKTVWRIDRWSRQTTYASGDRPQAFTGSSPGKF